MGLSTRQGNRGPAAAAENRQALLRAARVLFAEGGYGVPLSAIARAAGVGQAVLYRHFPRRLDLALAVFEENFAELAVLAERAEPDAFERLFERINELVLESFGFVELVVGARAVMADYDGDEQLAQLLAAPLERARRAGRVAAHVGGEDVALGLRMIYGVAATARDAEERQAAVARARAVVTRSWLP